MDIPQATAKALVQATTVDIFNERDQLKRRELMEKYWSPNLICYQPAGAGTGYDNIDRTFEALHAEGRNNYDFSVTGQIWVNHNLIYVGWEFGPGGVAGDEGMRGSDIMLVGQDGKVEVLDVIYKLLGFTFAMAVVPIGSYFFMLKTVFNGNATYSGAFAAIMANVVLVSYIVVAMREEDDSKPAGKIEVDGKKAQ